MGNKIIQRNIGMYPEDWAELDALAHIMRISSSAAMRFIVNCWRNRNIDDPQVRELVKIVEAETIPS